MEITFKHGKPKRGFRVVLDVQGDSAYESDVFQKTDDIKWKKGMCVLSVITQLSSPESTSNSRYIKTTAIVKLKLKAVYGTRAKMNITNRKSYARATLDLAKCTSPGESCEILIEGEHTVNIHTHSGL